MIPSSSIPADADRRAAILDFLNQLFGGKPETAYIYIWTLVDRISAYFTDLAEAATYAARRGQESDVYVGMSLTDRRFEACQRIKMAEGRKPAGIVGMWADFDFAGRAHQKQNLPCGLDDIRSLFLLPPSLVIDTGHGCHGYWLFKELWELDSDEEIQRAAVLAARWGRAIQARAATHGWPVDSVHDLSRVLRVAGTENRKIPTDVRDVYIVERRATARYCMADFVEVLDMVGAPLLAYDDVVPGANQDVKLSTKYDLGACAPRNKLQAILLIDSQFRLTWQGRRPDLMDQSPSSYDMASANFLAFYDLTDQEIVDALIERRRIHGQVHPTKYRPSYFAPTIARARRYGAQWRAVRSGGVVQ